MPSNKGKKVNATSPKKIEIIKGLKDLRLIKERFDLPEKPVKEIEERLLEKIGQPIETVEKRLEGLRTEDEFLLLCLVLGNIENIVPLEQKQYVNQDKYTIPDFLLNVRVPKLLAGDEKLVQRFFAETKKMGVNQKEFVISREYFNKLLRFSNIYSLPLYFAIKVNLIEYGLIQWFLVPSSVIEENSEIEERRIHGGRRESCYIVDVLTLLREDYSCLWLSNYSVYVQKGFKVVKEYSPEPISPIQSNELGYLVRVSCQLGDESKSAEFKIGAMDDRNLLFYIICRYLSRGSRTETETDELKTVVFEADNHYVIPFYHLVLSAYLHLRKEFQRVTGGPYIDDISYYLENFSILDQNIVALTKDILFELSDRKLILPIKMLPESIHEKSERPQRAERRDTQNS